jgi:hypothetical protein
MPIVQPSHAWTQQLAALAIIAVGLAFRWPVLQTGFTVDDYAQLAMIRGEYPVDRAPLSLFTFSDGSARENERLREVGFFPWWSAPDLRVSLLRPLSSALMWLDARALRGDALWYHLHSLCWWVAMQLVIWELLRRIMSGWLALLALGLFVLHPAHTVLLGWIANRNALVSTTFAVLGLIAQLRAQREAWKPGYALAATSYAIALMAGEYAVPTLAYGVCLSLVGPAAPVRRGRALAIWVAALFAYVTIRAGLGYGSRGSGMYLDPVHEPLDFVSQAVERFPVLMADAVLAVRSSWWSAGFPWARSLADAGWLSPLWAADLRPLRRVQVGLGVLACVVFAVVYWSYARRRRQSGRDLRFLGIGVPLALVPSVASLPESRLMVPAMIGWVALLLQAVADQWHAQRAKGRMTAALSCTPLMSLVLLAAFLAPCTTNDEVHGLPDFARAIRKSIATPELDSMIGGRQVLLAGSVDPTTSIYIPLLRRWYDRPAPSSCQLLLGGWSPLRLTRLGEKVFELERLNAAFTAPDVYASAFNRRPLRAGERFRSGELQATVQRVDDGRPMRVRFEMNQPLDAAYVLIVQTSRGLTPLPFPALGQSTIVPPAALPVRFLDLR